MPTGSASSTMTSHLPKISLAPAFSWATAPFLFFTTRYIVTFGIVLPETINDSSSQKHSVNNSTTGVGSGNISNPIVSSVLLPAMSKSRTFATCVPGPCGGSVKAESRVSACSIPSTTTSAWEMPESESVPFQRSVGFGMSVIVSPIKTASGDGGVVSIAIR